MSYYCLPSWDIFASVSIVVTALAVDCNVGTLNLATIFIKVKVLAIDDLFACYGIAICSEVCPDVRLDLSKAISYRLTVVFVIVLVTTTDLNGLAFVLDTILVKVVFLAIDSPLAFKSLTFSIEIRPLVWCNFSKATCYKSSTVSIILISLTIFDNSFPLDLDTIFIKVLKVSMISTNLADSQ